MNVKLLDLAAQYEAIREDAEAEVLKVLRSQRMILGENVKGLEADVAAYSGAKFALGCASGSDALILALRAFGIGHGAMVAIPAFTFFATAGAVSLTGATPVFVDIEPESFNMDAASLERAFKKHKKKIKAVIPVHLYGQCADMDKITKVTKKFGAKVVEDAAQSIGASYKGKGAGAIGDVGCFSFYPTKNLGGVGDGGMVTTNNQKAFDTLAMLRVHGSKVRYYHKIVGMNSRLDELQAAVLRVKFRKLDEWTNRRIENAAYYGKLFGAAGLAGSVTPPAHVVDGRHVYNQYVIRCKKRDGLREHLTKAGVGTDIYYPVPLHFQDCYKALGYKKGSFPVSEAAAKEVLAIPVYPELKREEIKYVVDSIYAFYAGK
ncbi:MAG: DegT/DnrJ/EryC1/StrS family aminotransferase [Deltaproteobacteria bacterium]|nr:DegT/DnrJ/EryC1/StrS family aminotransferase [Deltaproteobacteria bacterium]